MVTNREQETQAMLRVFDQLDQLQKELNQAKERIASLEAERMEHAALIHSDKGYTLGTLADADYFAEKRRRANDLGDCV
jgi:hypothetical protein